ncbi:hypothetical protein LTR94_036899, partial [Friedmanniomyces endolithicus]
TSEKAWAEAAKPVLATLRVALATADAELSETQEAYVISLEDRAEAIPKDEDAHAAARNWLVGLLPVFLYLDDYPEIEGHQDIAAYLSVLYLLVISEA